MTTLPSSLQWLKPPGYRYTPGPQSPAQKSAQDAYERARPTLASQPQGVDPRQAGQVLGEQGKGLVGTQLDAAGRAVDIATRGYQGKTAIDGQAYDQKKGVDADFYRDVVGVSVDGNLRLQNASFDRGLQMARELRGMGADTGRLVAGAITGEQTNDAARLKILETALRPTLVDNISGIAGAIAPLLAVFAA